MVLLHCLPLISVTVMLTAAGLVLVNSSCSSFVERWYTLFIVMLSVFFTAVGKSDGAKAMPLNFAFPGAVARLVTVAVTALLYPEASTKE